jgi:uroporphyrin-III C-methyltransferase
MINTPPPETAAPVSERPAPAGTPRFGLGGIALLLALAALGGMGWMWYDQHVQLDALRQELARKLADADTQSKESRLIAQQVRDATQQASVKIGVLESKLAESQSQQIALESLYQELSRNRDEWAYAEIEQSLLIASQQLQLAGNVRAALIALQNADARLQRMDRPQLTALRKAISRDIEQLKAVPHVDVIGISARLDAVIAAVDRLPLAMEVRPLTQAPPPAADTASGSAWTRFAREAWNDVRQLVRVQHMDKADIPILAPTQSFFLRENLKLRLIGARLALLTRDQASYKDDLSAARAWLTRYYDAGDKAVASTTATLRTLHESPISIQLPDISVTLDALRTYRQPRERTAR